MSEWIKIFSNPRFLAVIARILVIITFIPQAIKGFIWLFKWIFIILYFCFGWILPTYISKAKIRCYGFGVEYWLVVPMLIIFANRYFSGLFRFLHNSISFVHQWTIGLIWDSTPAIENATQVAQTTENAPSFFARLAEHLSPASLELLSQISIYLSDLSYLIPVIIVFSIIKLVQLPLIQDEGWLFSVLIVTLCGVGIAFNSGYLDEPIAAIKPLYENDRNLFIAWIIFSWFAFLYMLKRYSSFTSYNPVNGFLSKSNNTLIGKKIPRSGEGQTGSTFVASPFEIKMRSWISYLFLCGGLDYTSEIEDDHQQNFGLGVALFIWSCIYDDVEIIDGKPTRKKFSVFNRSQYFGQDFGLEQSKKTKRTPKQSLPTHESSHAKTNLPTEVAQQSLEEVSNVAQVTPTTEASVNLTPPQKPVGRIRKLISKFFKKK